MSKVGKIGKYSVKDLYAEAMRAMKKEMAGLKDKPLTEKETEQMDRLAKMLSNEVLKDMGRV